MSIDQLFRRLEVDVRPFSVCTFNTRWEAPLAGRESIQLYFVLEGGGRLQMAGGASTAFRDGCAIVCPPGVAASFEPGELRRTPGRPAVCRELLGLLDVKSGASEGSVTLMGGAIDVRLGRSAGLFDGLHDPIVEDVADSEFYARAVPDLVEELRGRRPGGDIVVECILKRCLITIVRSRWASERDQPSWWPALEHPRLRLSLSAMLDDPAHPHTVESLADLAGMSRSAFAQRFADAFKSPPMAMLRDIRLRRAATQLESTALSVKVIESAVGFRSRSNFWRAFKQMHGLDPASYRTARSAAGGAAGSRQRSPGGTDVVNPPQPLVLPS